MDIPYLDYSTRSYNCMDKPDSEIHLSKDMDFFLLLGISRETCRELEKLDIKSPNDFDINDPKMPDIRTSEILKDFKFLYSIFGK